MEECKATTSTYDHKTAREGISDVDKANGIILASHQYRQACNNEPIDCATCDRKRRLIHMHRCWFCGKYYCPQCSNIHFGDRFT